jgi:hypothetical protein
LLSADYADYADYFWACTQFDFSIPQHKLLPQKPLKLLLFNLRNLRNLRIISLLNQPVFREKNSLGLRPIYGV